MNRRECMHGIHCNGNGLVRKCLLQLDTARRAHLQVVVAVSMLVFQSVVCELAIVGAQWKVAKGINWIRQFLILMKNVTYSPLGWDNWLFLDDRIHQVDY